MPQKSNPTSGTDERATSIPQEHEDELEMADDDEEFEDEEDADEETDDETMDEDEDVNEA